MLTQQSAGTRRLRRACPHQMRSFFYLREGRVGHPTDALMRLAAASAAAAGRFDIFWAGAQ